MESIFPGGTASIEVQKKIKQTTKVIQSYSEALKTADFSTETAAQSIKNLLDEQETIQKSIQQMRTFIKMWHDAYTDDEHADVVMGQVMDLSSEMQKLSNEFTKKLVHIPDELWRTVLEHSLLKEFSFALNEIRTKGKQLLSDETETLIADLNQDGLAGWSKLYDTIVSTMTIPFTDKHGNTSELSVGQAQNRVYADPDAAVRTSLFENWEKTWSHYAPALADTLNHLAGYRLTLQQAHGRSHHLEEPLEYNRMSKETLDAMWGAIEKHKQPFYNFLQKKAEILGLEKLAWQDVEAPIAVDKSAAMSFTYDEACDFVLEHFNTFGPKLTAFTKHALNNRWVEAEDRSGKRPGGYCTKLPEDEESRIFMTFTGSSSDVGTLAHELGHAFHSEVMKDMPAMNRRYAMNVAETASTFAETIISNATIEQAETDEEKVALLNTKIERATAMFLNIHTRFLFEDMFYTERAEGIVSEKRLNELMTEAQKKAFGGQLERYHPYFWCAKLHFFMDKVPFYNFPYTFGYLFSLGIYAAYMKQPEGFEEKYIALLRDTATMTVEDLAKKHLGVDLTKQDFWEAGIELMEKDVSEFISLADKLKL